MKFKKSKLMVYLGIFLLLCVIVVYGLLEWGYSIGSRSGRLVKLSQKGFIFKEWEGTLDLGGGINLTWDFSIHDDDVGEQLKGQLGQMVNVDYKEHLFKFLYATKYEVEDWRPIGVTAGKICPFLFLLKDDSGTLKRAAELIVNKRQDLKADVEECLKKIGFP